MKKTLIYNARIICPSNNLDYDNGFIIIDNGKIADFGIYDAQIELSDNFDKIDANGHVISPSLCDIFTAVSCDGGLHKESISSLSRAAVASGITSILLDPDVSPILDNMQSIDYVKNYILQNTDLDFYISGAISHNLEGAVMTPYSQMRQCGISCISNADYIINHSLALRRMLNYAATEKMVVALSSYDYELANSGEANESFLSSLYGLSPIAASGEAIGIMRDILLADDYNCDLHIRNISSKQGLDVYRKFTNANTSLSVSIAHILLNENDTIPYKTFLKLFPPLRFEEDRLAIIEAICDGTIDIVYSQHRPRHSDSKRLPFSQADYGSSSIEALLPVILSLYHNGHLSLSKALSLVTTNPAMRFNMGSKAISKGNYADLVMIDLNYSHKIDKHNMLSQSNNTAFDGHILQGRALKTWLKGKLVYEA